MIVRVVIVVVEPLAIVIVIDIEYIEIAGGSRERMYEAPPVPLPVEKYLRAVSYSVS
jgi:hypothetical protein